MIAHVFSAVVLASAATRVLADAEHDHSDPAQHMDDMDGEDDHSAHADSPTEAGAEHDHTEHMGPSEGPASTEMNMATISGAEGAVGSEDSMCHWTYEKCVISKPYVADASGLPMGWARCTEKNIVTDVHATGWDCESDVIDDKAGMGCTTNEILHTMPEMAHLMDVCMPSTVSDGQAQAYWDTYDAYQVCIRDETMTAMDCADLVSTSFMNEMDIALPDVEVEGFQDALTMNIQTCAAATTEEACMMVEGTFDDMVTPVTGVTLAVTDATAADAPAATATTDSTAAADTAAGDAAAAGTTEAEDDAAVEDSGVCGASVAAALVGTAAAALLL